MGQEDRIADSVGMENMMPVLADPVVGRPESGAPVQDIADMACLVGHKSRRCYHTAEA